MVTQSTDSKAALYLSQASAQISRSLLCLQALPDPLPVKRAEGSKRLRAVNLQIYRQDRSTLSNVEGAFRSPVVRTERTSLFRGMAC